MAAKSSHTPSNDRDDIVVGSLEGDHLAADLIRDKLARIYKEEPDVLQDIAETAEAPRRSKHQRFMYELSTSGKDLATIQTEWHKYYRGLPAAEQHEVWQEFYASQSLLAQPAAAHESAQALAEHKQQAAKPSTTKKTTGRKLHQARSVGEVQTAVREAVTAGGKLEAKHHLQSLLFGFGMGLIVIIIFLFGFFNEVFIAPFIQPGRTSAATPLIVNGSGVAPTPNPEVIIPKINVEIPADYTQTSTDESTIENALESGVVHYPTTVMPGQTGNTAFFGHSSNNIFNKGKYKFAFVLLHTLVPGDTFYLTYQSKVYVYKVISRTIVDPSDVGVLGPVTGQTATATLITCDPPGTSLHRLVVVGQQISPDPAGNTTATTTATRTPVALPGNGQTLWGHFIQSNAGKTVVVVILAGGTLYALRWLSRPPTRR